MVARQKLYDEVWAEPMTVVAKRYDVSSSFLARVCERMNVPRPSRGYWTQLKVGRKVEKEPLHDARPGDELEWVRGDTRPRALPIPAKPNLRKRTKKIAGERPARHPLLVDVREHFERTHTSTYQDEKYLKPFKRNLVDILVSKESLKRALDVANEIFLSLEDRGHRVMMASHDARYSRVGFNHRDEPKKKDDNDYRHFHGIWRGPARPTLLFIDSVAIGLSLFELSEEVEVRYVTGGDSKYVRLGSPEDRTNPRRLHDWTTKQWWTSGRLCLHAYAPYASIRWEQFWREEKPGDLLSKLEDIATTLEKQAPELVTLLEVAAREAEERKKKWEIERREMERKEAERQKVEEEKARLVALKEQVEQFRFARETRALVEAIRELLKTRGLRVSKGGPLEENIEWLLKRADDADPLTDLRREADAMVAKHLCWPRPFSPLGARFAIRRRPRFR